MILYKNNYYFLMLFTILHSFVNIFADGYSDLKTYLFFTYLIILLSLGFLLKKITFRKIAWKYFAFSFLALFIYSASLHFFYILKNKIPLMKPFITGFNGEMSYSALWHMQISKGFIGVLVPHLDNIDAGRAYLGSFPEIVFLLGTFLLFLVLGQNFLYFISSFRELSKDKKFRQKFFLILAYSLLSFSLTKTAIDGGIFHPAFICGFSFLLFFIFRKKITHFYYLSTPLGVIFMLISIYSNHREYGSGWAYIQIATLILFYQLILYCTAEKIKDFKVIIFSLLFLSSWYLNAYRDLGMFKYSQFDLPLNQNVYYYDKPSSQVKIYEADKNNKKIKDLTKEFNKNIYYLPITINGKTCQEKFPYKPIFLTLISDHPLQKNQFRSSKMLLIGNQESVWKNNHWETSFVFSRSLCLPETFSVVNSELLKNGFSNYIYYNFSGF